MTTETVTVSIELQWDEEREEPRQALADILASMARGVRAGKRGGMVLRGGSWQIRKGAEKWVGPDLPSSPM